MENLNKHNCKQESGLTLVGILVALFILVVSILTSAQLMARTSHSTEASRERFVAINLAREGLELVQWVRDSNWLISKSKDCWTGSPTNFLPGTCTNNSVNAEVLCSDTNPHTFTIEANAGIGAFIGDAAKKDLYLDGEKFTHIVTSQKSPYSRLITVTCTDKDNDPAFIEVSSKVEWDSGNKNVELKEKLFNWYRP